MPTRLGLLELFAAPQADAAAPRRARVDVRLAPGLMSLLGARARHLNLSIDQVLAAGLALLESRLTGAERVCDPWWIAPATAALGGGASISGSRVAAIVVPDRGDLDTWLTSLRTNDSGSGAATVGDAAGDPRVNVWLSDPHEADAALINASAAWYLNGRAADAIGVEYLSAALSATSVQTLATAYSNLLAAMADPQRRELADVLALDAGEGTRVLETWNDTARPRQLEDTISTLFSAQARSAPSRVAVIHGTRSLSYAELDKRATDLAARLQAAGVRVGDCVALLLDRSIESVTAVLAVLKAGAAYVPLDRSHPPERLRFALQDAATTVLVHDGDQALHWADAATLLLHVDGAAAAAPFAAPSFDGNARAYVMYTSGSTGTPKGVEIRHRSVIRLVRDVTYVTLDAEVRMLHAAPLGFDASTLELWGPLLNGGCCVLHDEPVPTGAGLAHTIATHGVTTAWLTAALFNAVIDDDPRHLSGLRELLTGGEALSVAHVRKALAALPAVTLINGYGPTECTTFTCTQRIARDTPAEAQSIPIGRPIADTTVYILNARMQPVPVGVIGELYVGGEGLALGYLGRPELTAERFVSGASLGVQSRLYKTGDLARFRSDGSIEFIGRADGQVKIRGFRIETGEIEFALMRHAAVRAAAVIAREDRPGDKRLVAYVVAHGAPCDGAALRKHLHDRLPEFMVPAAIVWLDSLPLTGNGKLDRRALPLPTAVRADMGGDYEAPADPDEARIATVLAEALAIDALGRHDNFFAFGGNSLLALRAIERLNRGATATLSATQFFRDPTPRGLAATLRGEHDAGVERARRSRHQAHSDSGVLEPIAIIAMAGRFPGADSIEALWQNLCAGRESIRFFRDEDLDAGVSAVERGNSDYVKARGVIAGVENFDAAFFGISPREAELMDPQQRVFLELCWECLERGGHVPDNHDGPVGIFAGMYNATYFQRHVSAHPDKVDKVGAFQVMLGNEKDYIATRVAYRLNLTGPAVSVHTACSTSLVAICQAFDALRRGACDMALAGGASILCPPNSGYLYQEGAMLSPDGHTRSFDAKAQGTVFSDGAAVVLLKRLSDALADGDAVYAVITGAAINNDGGGKASFTAPGSEGQAAVIAMAHDIAGVDARSISYVETHGTATPLGDPIEIEGLTKAFRRTTADTGFCGIGSIKSNLGHTVIAAGAAGAIKTALSLSTRLLPPSINFSAPNPGIDFADSPFAVNDKLREWPAGASPRRAGVSSFGVGGTNAHVVMEEAPPRAASEPATGAQLLVLSARTPSALTAMRQQLAAHLHAYADSNLADVAYTLAEGRKVFAYRGAVVADSAAAAVVQLQQTQSTDAELATARDVVFLFPGQGAQYAGMGRQLHRTHEVFRDAVDNCARLLQPELGFDLRERLFADDAAALEPTQITQPATFVIEYALAQLWLAQGIVPAALIGHSVGEFVAAVIAGVMRLDDALRLVARRGRLMQAQPSGAMLSVRLDGDSLRARLPAELSMAAENGPQAHVVAGSHEAIERFRAALEADAVACRVLRTSHAFHSAMMDPVVAPFRAEFNGIALAPARIPIVSTLTGDWLDAGAALSPDYWSRHLREPVRFAGALSKLLDAPARVLLEIGPRNTLTTLARQQLGTRRAQIGVVASLTDGPDAEHAAVLAAAGELWRRGVDIAPQCFAPRRAFRRVLLPTYPFERQRHWVDAAPSVRAAVVTDHDRPIAIATNPVLETPMQVAPSVPAVDRRAGLIERIKAMFDDVAGIDLGDADVNANFVELGLDSLTLTQVALQVQKTFAVKVTFRQLMENQSSLNSLSEFLDQQIPADAAPAASVASTAPSVAIAMPVFTSSSAAGLPQGGGDLLQQVIAQQMQIMSQQLAMLRAGGVATPATAVPVAPAISAAAPIMPASPKAAASADAAPGSEEAALAHTTYDVKKAFGAIARIHHSSDTELTDRQRARLGAFIRRYVARTQRSKDYTTEHRPHLADPRVVNGFRPLLKEIIYQVVVERSQGSRVWDLDGNEYIDILNGFGMNLFGWQPDFVVDAIKRQIDLGYEIGPQHPLAGEVARLVCEVTGFDRAGLCNTGSEAVMGTIRIARTITGRNTLVVFTGAYHGIFDEVLVRGTKKLRSVPAAPGILRNTAENVLVLDYGTPETMAIIRERAHEIAAVLVEPVQSRRPDFQPREFLQELRQVTRDAGALLIFDEVVTGFRAHPRGAQHVLGVDADLASYGKVVGGGFPIGVIAGKRQYMDALDGGHWQFGDDSIPTVGVTYFAGTFVRHPLALAAAKAVLLHLKAQGPELQARLNARTAALVDELNRFCGEVGAPIAIKHFASVWKLNFLEDHPLQDLLFAMLRSRGIHVLDNFPCFFTTAHSEADFTAIAVAFKDSVRELQEAEFMPRRETSVRSAFDASKPPLPGARLGRDPDGTPAWFVPNPDAPGKFLKVNA